MSDERETEIKSCFSRSVDFHYPNRLETFNNLLDEFKPRSNTAKTKALDTYSSEEVVNNDGFREETKHNQLLVMHNISGLADESKMFASFLTVACKFDYSCVYIFHTIYPEKNKLEIDSFTNEYFKYFSSKCFVNKCRKNFRRCLYQKNKKVYSITCALEILLN